MEKKFTYEKGTVTVHGWERWPSERLAPILKEYISNIGYGKEGEDAA